MKDAIHDLMAKLKDQGCPAPGPASLEDLNRGQSAGFPGELLDFYRECEPENCIELKQRIWSIENAIIENDDAVPGCALSPHGFIVFASTVYGDAYCIDTNVVTSAGRHPVVLFPHEAIGEDASLSDILRLRLEVASSFEDFLRKFTDGTLNEEPSYG